MPTNRPANTAITAESLVTMLTGELQPAMAALLAKFAAAQAAARRTG